MQYDIVVIGGGPGGYTAAIRAAQYNNKVALIEKQSLGGTCLNRGCIPTKSLLHSTSKFNELKTSESYGVLCNNLSFDMNKAYQYKDNIVSKLNKGIESLIKANKIDLYQGNGSFVDNKTVAVGNSVITGTNIIIATGSVPATIPVQGVEYTLNSDDVLMQPVEGEDIVIVGVGVIGVEFANIFSDAGKNVTIIEALDRLIPMMDKDLSQGLTMALKKKKVKIVTSAMLKKIDKSDKLTVIYEDMNGEKQLICDNVILCAGRKPNTEGLGLDSIGLEVNRGCIKVDDKLNTVIPNIYAIGDVTGGIQLAHYASAQGMACIDSIMNKPQSVNLNLVPSCIYTSPEIASVGLTESECDGMNVDIGKFMIGANGKSLINGHMSGFVKVIVDKNSDSILGASLIMPHATDLVAELALAISAGVTRQEFIKVIHPHPTFVESIYEAMEDSQGKAIHLMPKR